MLGGMDSSRSGSDRVGERDERLFGLARTPSGGLPHQASLRGGDRDRRSVRPDALAQHRTTRTKFENVLLFVTYWVPPFAAIQMVDWWRKRGKMDVRQVLSTSLKPGWEALVALLAGFAAATPFMDTSLYVGYASSQWLQGGDIAFAVGFVVGGLVYGGIRGVETGSVRDLRRQQSGRSRCLAQRQRTDGRIGRTA